MEYRPYKLLNASELAEIGKQVEAAFIAWASDWLGDAVLPATVACRRAAECDMTEYPEAGHWICLGIDRKHWIALTCASVFTEQLRLHLIPGHHGPTHGDAAARNSPILSGLVRAAQIDLLQMFPVIAKQECQLSDQRYRETGSGAAIAEIAWKEAKLALVISPMLAASMLGQMARKPARNGSLANVNDAITDRRLSLKVLAGEAEVELGLLQTIAIGDVIKLDTRVGEPLQVVNLDRHAVCRAFLGVRNGRKSIQLIK